MEVLPLDKQSQCCAIFVDYRFFSYARPELSKALWLLLCIIFVSALEVDAGDQSSWPLTLQHKPHTVPAVPPKDPYSVTPVLWHFLGKQEGRGENFFVWLSP